MQRVTGKIDYFTVSVLFLCALQACSQPHLEEGNFGDKKAKKTYLGISCLRHCAYRKTIVIQNGVSGIFLWGRGVWARTNVAWGSSSPLTSWPRAACFRQPDVSFNLFEILTITNVSCRLVWPTLYMHMATHILYADARWKTAGSDGYWRATERNNETDSAIQGIFWYTVFIKVKGPGIYIPPLTGKPEQQRFTIRSGVLTSTSRRWRGTVSTIARMNGLWTRDR